MIVRVQHFSASLLQFSFSFDVINNMSSFIIITLSRIDASKSLQTQASFLCKVT